MTADELYDGMRAPEPSDLSGGWADVTADEQARIARPEPCPADYCAPYIGRKRRCPECTGDCDLPVGQRWEVTDESLADHDAKVQAEAFAEAERSAAAARIAHDYYAELVAAAEAMLDHDALAHECDSAAAGRVRAALDRLEARP